MGRNYTLLHHSEAYNIRNVFATMAHHFHTNDSNYLPSPVRLPPSTTAIILPFPWLLGEVQVPETIPTLNASANVSQEAPTTLYKLSHFL